MKIVMRRLRVWFGLVVSLGFALPALASESTNGMSVGWDMVETYKCVACHRVDEGKGRKRLGPDFSIIAERYAGEGDEAVVDYLATKIRKGARGSWGAVPMPAQSHVSEDEARVLAQWILSLVVVEPLAEK